MTQVKERTVKAIINIKVFFLAVLFAIGLSTSVQAIEDSKINFTKDMHLNIITVTDNYFNVYDVIMNRPLAQLVEVDNFAYQRLLPVKEANSIFAIAMQAQDKIQYFMVLIDSVFDEDHKPGVEQECLTTRLANLFF